jgi:hypothetical protein
MDFPDYMDSGYWAEPDFLLADLVSLMANKMGAQLGMTLMIKGSVLTGTLVGEREYLETINRLFKSLARESMVKPSKDDLTAIDQAFQFDLLTEDTYPDEDDDEADETLEDEPLETPPIRYLHLKDPMIIYPGSTISFTDSALPILRLRLSMVDGWLPGRITIISDDDLPAPGPIH